MEGFREGEDDSADPGVGVGFAQPGEACRAAGGDLLASADGDEEVVGELPDSVGDGGPAHHGAEVVVLRASGRAVFDIVDGGEAFFLDCGGGEVD